jgi:IS30 family transposase
VAANGGRDRYRACAADRRAVRLLHRPKPARLAVCPRRGQVVESKLELRWSPRQIAGWLALAYPDDPEMQVSHETIYLSLFVQARGALRKELTRCLRTGRARRRPRGLATNNGQGKIGGMVNISQRPAEASDRAVPGHWEGDLLFGTRSSTVATLVERKEWAGHARFSVATGVPVCFCDPHSPWQRGSNENTNGLLRQYFPRSTDFRALTQRDLDDVAAELNGRPRQTPGWKSPCQALDQALR